MVQLPETFLRHIQGQASSQFCLDDFIDACGRPLKRSVRVNTLRSSVEDFKRIGNEKGWKLKPIPWCAEGFWLDEKENNALGNCAEHLAGLFYVQEASSMLPVSALFEGNKNFSYLLDMAAAPGSKTTQIAAKMQNKGLVVANEYSASRIKALHSNLVRCGIHNVALTHFDGCVFGDWLPETFDAILLDAPCSGEGTVRKDPHAFKNWSLGAIETISNVQKKLIESAFHALKPQGTLVYSTCTLSHEENQHVCYYLKEKFGDAVTFESLSDLFEGAEEALTAEGFLHVFPQTYDCEGFFIAKIRKNASIDSQMVKKPARKFPFNEMKGKNITLLNDALLSTFSFSLPEEVSVWQRDKDIWLFPNAVIALLPEIRFERIGVKIAEIHKHGYKWQHEGITSIYKKQDAASMNISEESTLDWYMGRDIRLEYENRKGEIVVCYRNAPIGIGKWLGNKIKNNLPRELVRDGLQIKK